MAIVSLFLIGVWIVWAVYEGLSDSSNGGTLGDRCGWLFLENGLDKCLYRRWWIFMMAFSLWVLAMLSRYLGVEFA